MQLNHDHWVNDVEFAGDMVISVEHPETAEPVLDRTACEAMSWRYTSKKRSFFTTSYNPSNCTHTNGESLEHMHEFKYLGPTTQLNFQAKEKVYFV